MIPFSHVGDNSGLYSAFNGFCPLHRWWFQPMDFWAKKQNDTLLSRTCDAASHPGPDGGSAPSLSQARPADHAARHLALCAALDD
ncbi:hypothetical protein [Pseudorhodobacter sp. E13]|uniref:hypothetical protein n=1 Tax=Pseudorhodobacter sp. E13 TaxID=2487931 RepID=UPI001F46B9DB|nr:hypothetical protein [Pseudorhodobacter sp. E13]